MDTSLFFVTAPFCLFLLLLSLELVRRRRLKEKYALLWIFSTLVMLVISLFPRVIMRIAPLMHMHHLTLVVFIAFFFLILLCMGYSVSISRLTENNKVLNQEMALLAQRVEELEETLKSITSRKFGA